MPITENEVREAVALGEDSSRQFKVNITNAESLAAEMAAFANSSGGIIYIGVSDSGELAGLMPADVGRINQLISNAASQLIRSPLNVQTSNVRLGNGKLVIVLAVPKGLDKPYFDKNGVIWLKTGADKRRVNSKEELRRLFQVSNQFHADELPTRADISKLDKLLFRDFLQREYSLDLPSSHSELAGLLQNLNLATENGYLNLAGVLLFAQKTELIVPEFVVKAVCYPGTSVHVSDYMDTEEYAGTLPRLFEGVFAFIMRNLRKIQAGNGINSPGTPEIPAVVIEELLVNALLHRDYMISAPIRVFVYDDRIEIVNPGHLPNNLTVEKIKAGNSNIRNPILVSYAAKRLLPYHGIGSGIKRVLAAWPMVDLVDDPEGCQFTAIVHRKQLDSPKELAEVHQNSPKSGQCSPKNSLKKEGDSPKTGADSAIDSPKDGQDSPKTVTGGQQGGQTDLQILGYLRANSKVSTEAIARELGLSKRTITKRIQKLKAENRLKRHGPARGGWWEVIG